MTETKVQYVTSDTTCPNCSHLGEIETMGGMDVLMLCGVAVTNLHGICPVCGKEVHFNSRDRQLARLIESVKRLRGAKLE